MDIPNVSGSNMGYDEQSGEGFDNSRTFDNDDSDNYVPLDAKQGKYDLNLYNFYDLSAAGRSNDMPKKYCHVRESERKVREEICSVMHLVSSKLRKSKS